MGTQTCVCLCVCVSDPEAPDSRSYLGPTSPGRVESAAASLSWPARSIWPVPLVIVNATANTKHHSQPKGKHTHTFTVHTGAAKTSVTTHPCLVCASSTHVKTVTSTHSLGS